MSVHVKENSSMGRRFFEDSDIGKPAALSLIATITVNMALYSKRRIRWTGGFVVLLVATGMVYPLVQFAKVTTNLSLPSRGLPAGVLEVEATLTSPEVSAPVSSSPITAVVEGRGTPCGAHLLVSGTTFEGNNTGIKTNAEPCLTVQKTVFRHNGVAIDMTSPAHPLKPEQIKQGTEGHVIPVPGTAVR